MKPIPNKKISLICTHNIHLYINGYIYTYISEKTQYWKAFLKNPVLKPICYCWLNDFFISLFCILYFVFCILYFVFCIVLYCFLFFVFIFCKIHVIANFLLINCVWPTNEKYGCGRQLIHNKTLKHPSSWHSHYRNVVLSHQANLQVILYFAR